MPVRRTEALGSVRQSAEDDHIISGMAVPYGVTSRPTELISGSGQVVREVFRPGAFAADVERWNGRQDGGRMAFRAAHGQPAIGVVLSLAETPEGVPFTARIFDSPEGDNYRRDVREGLNGISVEAGFDTPPRVRRDGLVVHREAQLFAIAGSTLPAYDGARIALRDMEDSTVDPAQPAAVDPQLPTQLPADHDTNHPAAATAPAAPVQAPRAAAGGQTTDLTPAERSAAEQRSAAAVAAGVQITRPEAIYGPRSGFSYFADQLHAREGDGAAAERQRRHAQLLLQQVEIMERAGDVLSSEVPGAYPNQYLPGLLTPRILKGRPMGGFFNRFPITDATPKIFPKVTTSTTVAVQSAEGANPAASDLATTAVTATPLLYGGSTDVARQVLDGADPSIDTMLMQDLTEAYAQASETVIKTAVEAGASASGTAITAATPYAGMLGNVIKYQTTRFSPAGAQFVPSALYAVALAQGDTTGRPFLPWLGPTNSAGTTAAGGTGAQLLDCAVLLSWASTANVVVTARATDYVIYESSIAQFRYDQVVGPAAIRIGIWAYLVVGTRLGGLSVTAA